MTESIFNNNPGLDTAYLDATYADDKETAVIMFKDYLKELPDNLSQLRESILNKDVEKFRHLLHKQKPAFSYVGLTDITHSLTDLHAKCLHAEDLNTHNGAISQVVERINSSSSLIEQALARLQDDE